MPRIDSIRRRLENWQRWMLEGSSSALGYPRRSAFLRMVPATSTTESVVPVDDVEAAATHDAVESLRLRQSHLYQVLQLTYLRCMTAGEAGRAMGKGASTIALYLEQADRAIEAWLVAQSRERRGVLQHRE
ncbi:MAG: hypothetical protein AB7S53_02890 [Thiomonas sp.]